MTRGEILVQVLLKVMGKPESEVRDLFDNMCAANPVIAAGFAQEVPEEEARKQMDAMIAEGPGIMLKLLKGASDVSKFESGTFH